MEVRRRGALAEALRELETFTPHVIVSDIGMPDDDGYSLIRQRPHAPAEEKKNIPAIALTAFARNEDRTRALVEGFNSHGQAGRADRAPERRGAARGEERGGRSEVSHFCGDGA